MLKINEFQDLKNMYLSQTISKKENISFFVERTKLLLVVLNDIKTNIAKIYSYNHSLVKSLNSHISYFNEFGLKSMKPNLLYKITLDFDHNIFKINVSGEVY